MNELTGYSFYYIIPLILTFIYAFSYFFVHVCLKCFDCINIFWDEWDNWRKAFPPLVVVELAYFGAILYYIVYHELSGGA